MTEKLSEQVKQEALKQMKEEQMKTHTARYKAKLQETEDARAVVRNLERELAEIAFEIDEL